MMPLFSHLICAFNRVNCDPIVLLNPKSKYQISNEPLPAAELRGIRAKRVLTDPCESYDTRSGGPCARTYLRIASSEPERPTVIMKYPSDQNSPPQNCLRTSGARLNTSLAVILFTVCTMRCGSIMGTDWMRKWT